MNTNNITLYNGDCMEHLHNIEDASVDCIVTSPPYNKKFFNGNRNNFHHWRWDIDYASYSDDMPIEEYETWMIDFITVCLKKLKPNGSFFFNHKPIRHNNRVYFPIKFILDGKFDIYQEIIWDRKSGPDVSNKYLMPSTERVYWLTNGVPKFYRNRLPLEYKKEVWSIAPDIGKNHPAPFTDKLVENLITMSTDENDLVLDPFMGIGTTGIVARKLNRKFVGIELDKGYFDIATESITSIGRYDDFLFVD